MANINSLSFDDLVPQSKPKKSGIQALSFDDLLPSPVTNDMSGTDKFFAGMGKSISDTGSALKQGAQFVGNKMGIVDDSTYAQTQADIDATKKRDAALMDTGAGIAGNIAGAVGQFLVPGGALSLAGRAAGAPALMSAAKAVTIPQSIAGSAALGAVQGGMQPVASDESFGRNVALGGAVGAGTQAVAKGIGKLVTPIERTAAGATPEAIEAAQRIGYQATPGDITGNKMQRTVESVLENLPGSGGKMQALRQGNQEAFNSAAASAMGEKATRLSESVFKQARERIGGEFNRLTAGGEIAMGDDFINALANLDTQQKSLQGFARKEVDTLIDNGLALAANGKVSGQTYQTIRSRLGKQAKDAFASNNSDLGTALKSVQEALDSAASSGLNDADKKAWQVARQQWKALRTLEKGAVAEGGDVAPGRLAAAMRTSEGPGFRSGTVDGPLMDIARVAEGLPSRIPDSGTAQRSAMQNILTGGMAAGGLMSPTYALTGLLAPYLGSRAYLSDAGKKYMTQGLLNGPIDAEYLALLNAGLLPAASASTRGR